MTTPALRDRDLFRQQAFIDGRWCDADSREQMPVHDPATREELAQVPVMGEAETRRAIAAAERAWPAWRGKTAKERAAVLRRWHALVLDHQDDLAHLMTAEQGKTLMEATSEVLYAASFIEWFAEEGKRAYGDVIPTPAQDRRIVVLKQPVGVCAAITPWNFPLAMITRKVAPALAAGCPIVLKPAPQTPLTALAAAALADRAGVPAGIFSVVTGDAVAIGREMTTNPTVRKVTFTGSTPVGRILMRQCADTVKRLSLELGGNSPFIVFEDADLDAAVAGAVTSKYRNTGQACVGANRFLVHEAVYDSFADKLAAATRILKVGNGLDPDVHLGPLIDQRAVEKVETLVADAVAQGAKVLAGGRRHPLGGTFYEPTVLTDATPAMRLAQEEIFGPVSALFRFGTEAEAITMANDTDYGLAAYFYTRDVSRAWRVGEALEYGLVGCNAGMISNEVAPFGGMKQSGLGREGSKYGIDEYLELKYLCFGGV
jgi:succinate-semialdehyde dehydrogenase/glutarate-semialdehyde dehydrogenase